jgi:3-phosphoshikimate 1-carboxyvinyltransferase
MSFAIASLLAEGETEIKDAACVEISYPNFFHNLEGLS